MTEDARTAGLEAEDARLQANNVTLRAQVSGLNGMRTQVESPLA